MSRYDHKIETSLEGIENLSKEKKEKERRKMKEKNQKSIRFHKRFERKDERRVNQKRFEPALEMESVTTSRFARERRQQSYKLS